MSTCSTLEALELLLKGTVTCHTFESLRARLVQGRPLWVKAGFGAKVAKPLLRMELRAGDTVLVRVGKLKLQRWVIQ